MTKKKSGPKIPGPDAVRRTKEDLFVTFFASVFFIVVVFGVTVYTQGERIRELETQCR